VILTWPGGWSCGWFLFTTLAWEGTCESGDTSVTGVDVVLPGPWFLERCYIFLESRRFTVKRGLLPLTGPKPGH
jgi:hypothetical protein